MSGERCYCDDAKYPSGHPESEHDTTTPQHTRIFSAGEVKILIEALIRVMKHPQTGDASTRELFNLAHYIESDHRHE